MPASTRRSSRRCCSRRRAARCSGAGAAYAAAAIISTVSSQEEARMTALSTEFRRLHDTAQPLCLANAWDAGSARLIESLGAAAIATTSVGVAWALGYPDGNRLPIGKLAEL